jgi:hypothetical protein
MSKPKRSITNDTVQSPFLLVLRVYFLPATEEERPGLIHLRKVAQERIRTPCSWWWTYDEVHLALK